MPADVRPFARQNAVHDGVARRAVLANPEVPDHAFTNRAQRLDGALRSKVEAIRPQTDHLAAERIERMAQQHQLARRVDVGPLIALRIPRVTDLDAIDPR